MRHLLAPAVVLATALALSSSAAAQTPRFDAFPAFNEATAVATEGTTVWVGAPGGVFSYDAASGELARYTPVDGLTGGDIGDAYADPAGVLWVGYADGVLDRLDAETGEVRSFFDIERASQYASRGVRRIRPVGDRLFIATDFGIVVFDPARGEVRETYARLGTLGPATAVNDILLAPLPDGRAGLWAATEAGIVRAALDDPNLQIPSAWTADEGFEGSATSLGVLGSVFAGGGPDTARDLYERLPDGTWTRRLFANTPMPTILSQPDRLVVVTQFNVAFYTPGQPSVALRGMPAVQTLRDAAITADGQIWVADAGVGLVAVPEPSPGASGTVDYDATPVLPEGPYTNKINDIAASDGHVWAVTARLDATQRSSVNRLEDGVWTTLLSDDEMGRFGDDAFKSVDIGPDGTVYVGSTGDGLVVIAPDGAVERFDERNSSLLSAPSSSNTFTNVWDVAFEGGDRWVLNVASPRPLHYWPEGGELTALPRPVGIGGADELQRIAIDRFGQKWFSVQRTGGLAVWDTGADPADPSDDRGRRFTGGGGGQGLPGSQVRDVVVDLEGRVWLGTERGIAYVFSPGSAFDSDPALAVPQWPRVDQDTDTSDEEGASYLLRDVDVSDLAVDPAGQLWVATTSGLYLVNAQGDAVVETYTADNSPLPSDDIQSVTVDAETGAVYVTTVEGLYAIRGDATAPRPSSEALRVSPSPFRPARGDRGLLVSGLAAARSDVRVLTVSGEVVHAASVAGGSFRWNGLDDRTGRPVPSGVYIVAAASEGGETLYGKIAVIR